MDKIVKHVVILVKNVPKLPNVQFVNLKEFNKHLIVHVIKDITNLTVYVINVIINVQTVKPIIKIVTLAQVTESINQPVTVQLVIMMMDRILTVQNVITNVKHAKQMLIVVKLVKMEEY